MRELQDQLFKRGFDYGDLVCADLGLRNCTFDNCGLSLTSDPARMARISRVTAINCYSLNSRIGPCYLDDVRVEGLRTGDIMIVWGALFRHVVLRGKVGSLKINTAIQDPHATAEDQRAFDRLRQEYYAGIDWALDISGAKPLLLDIKGIPADRLILDPATQVAVSRKRLHDARQLNTLPGLDRVVRFSLEQFIKGDAADTVLVAPTGRSRKFFAPVVESFGMLTAAGLTGVE